MGILGSDFDRALDYALAAHTEQLRKGTEIPYAAHLLAVASLILEAGGTERAAVVGLLHDVVEDQGSHRLAEIRAEFGDEVAAAVLECSAEEKETGLGWRERKERYVAQMRTASPTAALVSLADKVHNLRSILADYRQLGLELFGRFGAPDPEAVLWYYQSLLDVYTGRQADVPAPLVAELRRTLGELRLLMSRPTCPRGHGDVVPVAMGYPDPELFEEAEAGRVVLGGCCVHGNDPEWECLVCHQRRPSRAGAPWPEP